MMTGGIVGELREQLRRVIELTDTASARSTPRTADEAAELVAAIGAARREYLIFMAQLERARSSPADERRRGARAVAPRRRCRPRRRAPGGSGARGAHHGSPPFGKLDRTKERQG
jgi:hypothetical protein